MKPYFLWICLALSAFNCFAQKENYPVYGTATPPFGLYQSKDDYLNLRVSDTEVLFKHVAAMTGDGVNDFFRKKENGKMGERVSPKNYFAASDGKAFYISYNGEWYKARKIDSEYCFLAHPMKIPDALKSRTHVLYSYNNGFRNDPINITQMEENEALFKMMFSLKKGEWEAKKKMKKLR
ncbi:MAG: hypothetical protein ABI378_12495 [Chitinophagaceae bacterium]